MPPEILTFNRAIEISGIDANKRHLLLGNGFSIAWRNDIFRYESLFDQANFSDLSAEVQSLFEDLNTKDFEIVMRHLREAASVLRVYSPTSTAIISALENDAEALRDVLVRTIAANHPDTPGDISDDEYNHCRTFLNHFCMSNIYSLNYDLLLYWVLMHFRETENELRCDDGFRKPDTGEEQYVSWDIENTNKQNVFHLHGALYLFDAGAVLKKYTWSNTGIRLIDQVRDALNHDLFPLIVSEGSTKEKQEKIMHSSYLSRSQRSISNISGSLFIYGHSLADNDDHILKLISKKGCKVRNLFVSLYGSATSESNIAIIRKAEQIKSARNQNNPLELYFYDAESAHVWR